MKYTITKGSYSNVMKWLVKVLCTALLLSKIYLPTKVHDDISHTFQTLLRNRTIFHEISKLLRKYYK